ncbi:hypothetical protein QCA50_016220 [Cerrena zonata]|uniref:Phospholipid-transporting ATPase n=1 Tax=Cerrena zonata TaxID=2478898 RepID=A0AAW0FGF2_9APHY
MANPNQLTTSVNTQSSSRYPSNDEIYNFGMGGGIEEAADTSAGNTTRDAQTASLNYDSRSNNDQSSDTNQLAVKGDVEQEKENNQYSSTSSSSLNQNNQSKYNKSDQKIHNEQFMFALALCHTVVTEQNDEDPELRDFKAESPDEAALVSVASDVGIVFKNRMRKSVILSIYGEDQEFELLEIIPFSSARKRMSCIFRFPDGTIKVISKGADNVIFQRLSSGTDDDLIHKTALHLEDYAKEGLRTLCIAERELDPKFFDDWHRRYKEAASSIEDDAEIMLEKLSEDVESDLLLLGGTAIEDRLQQGVPDSIALLAQAGIKLWVLTGDRIETAINIGFSCNLLGNDMKLLVVRPDDKDASNIQYVDELISKYLKESFQIEASSSRDIDGLIKSAVKDHSTPSSNAALIIDGAALSLVFNDSNDEHIQNLRKKFLILGKQCNSVLCCRVSPAQKAEVVKIVKNSLKVMTLAIGDGANDVAMIQAANVGVGIAGEEGRQAVMSSDYAIGPLESAIMEVVDVDEWFDKVQPLKYNQALTLFDGRIVMTPHNAGHTLGGTFWLITKRLEKIIYAPSWNHSKDSFLNSASFLSTSTGNPLSSLIRPTVLITNTDLGSSMSHKKRTEKFLQLVDATLANGGAVLLPTTLSGRFLELLHLVDEHLQGAPIPVYFLSYSGTRVLSYASNFLEWMSSQLFKSYEDFAAGDATGQSKLPFNPAKVDLLLDPDELIQLAGPKIVFASGIDLKNGDMSSQALQYLCQDEKTTIILTEKTHFGSEGSINAQLFKSWYNLAKKKQGGQAPEDGVAVPFEETISLDSWTREEKLIGGELAEFQQRINNQRQQKLLAKVREKQNENLLNTDSLNAEDSSEDEDEGNTTDEERTDEQTADPSKATPSINNGLDSKAIAVNQLSAHETFITDYVKESLEAYRPLDIKITYKLRPRQAMFPYISNNYKQNFDDYGEVIDVKSFQKADESSNKKLIMESKKKFEKKWGNDKMGIKKTAKIKTTIKISSRHKSNLIMNYYKIT